MPRVDDTEVQTAESDVVANAEKATTPQPAVQSLKSQRVVHIVKHCGYGNGNVHVAVDLACVQAEAGCDVTFVSGGGTFEPLLRDYGVRHVMLTQDQRRPLSLMTAAWRLAKLARETRPDILHAHMMGSAVAGYFASRIARVPLVTTVHNSFNRHSTIMRLGDRVVAVSVGEKEHLVAQGYNKGKVDVIVNAPVNSPRAGFMKNERDIEVQSPCITTVCGLNRRKGVFDLIMACAGLLPRLPEWRLYIAGEGPDRATLEEQARTLGIADKVIFLGFVADPRSLLEQSDIFVLASYADPCSLVIGEARAAGCAIVATAVGGTPEMLKFGAAGRLVSPGHPEQLASELSTLMTDHEARVRLRKAASSDVGVFDVHRLLVDYDRVYSQARRESFPGSHRSTQGDI